MRKITILTLTFVSLGILPVAAQFTTNKSQLGQVWNDFQSYSTDLQNYFQYNLNDNLKPVELQSRNALNNAKGELNIPNPVSAGDKVRDDLILYSRSDRFENNAAVRGNLVSNELNRVITRGAAASLLGENGQIRSKIKLIDTERSLQNISGFAEAAEEQTQSLLSKIPIPVFDASKLDPATAILAQLLNANQSQSIKIQQEQSKIIGETFAQTIQTNQSLQYSNLNLANISEQTEEANRARRVETSSEAARLLRATSQIDLFGRKDN
ncbi:MAG: hypothetical protein FWK04_00125 [Nostoc sp. GBBB01]|uniref:Uncharacterized protein n=1 Tax=Nostoc punctiforme FACHB-252 TaxID=1357509 RepID=A0ABR8HG68_NOSPU|nr:hypothetical protein [Nostoc punctiforme]MBD2614256.1 hypothetical protein [Nostoc punctiforme FACHB-252]MBL1197514.1 hypothetical protein [Nostoc sp. GBBB01]